MIALAAAVSEESKPEISETVDTDVEEQRFRHYGGGFRGYGYGGHYNGRFRGRRSVDEVPVQDLEAEEHRFGGYGGYRGYGSYGGYGGYGGYQRGYGRYYG